MMLEIIDWVGVGLDSIFGILLVFVVPAAVIVASIVVSNGLLRWLDRRAAARELQEQLDLCQAAAAADAVGYDGRALFGLPKDKH